MGAAKMNLIFQSSKNKSTICELTSFIGLRNINSLKETQTWF